MECTRKTLKQAPEAYSLWASDTLADLQVLISPVGALFGTGTSCRAALTNPCCYPAVTVLVTGIEPLAISGLWFQHLPMGL
jgi:hypothetical protein